MTTGVSAADRMTTIRAAISPWATPADLNRPGHVFPLVARENGVFARQGHTEGSVDLVKLANLPPFAVLCELTNEDGTMARMPEIEVFSRRHGFPVVSIADIVAWRFAPGKTRTAVNARSGSLNETPSFFMPYGARRRRTAWQPVPAGGRHRIFQAFPLFLPGMSNLTFFRPSGNWKRKYS